MSEATAANSFMNVHFHLFTMRKHERHHPSRGFQCEGVDGYQRNSESLTS